VGARALAGVARSAPRVDHRHQRRRTRRAPHRAPAAPSCSATRSPRAERSGAGARPRTRRPTNGWPRR
jgi:hypothetical protein